MIDLIINLYETNISLRVSFLLPLELCWHNGAKIVLKLHLKNLQVPNILKGNTHVEAVWHLWGKQPCFLSKEPPFYKNETLIAGRYVLLPLRQWGAGNFYLLAGQP